MKDEKFINSLLGALKAPEVRDEIKSICSNTNAGRLPSHGGLRNSNPKDENTIAKMKEDLRERDDRIFRLKWENDDLRETAEGLEMRLEAAENENKQLKKENEDYTKKEDRFNKAETRHHMEIGTLSDLANELEDKLDQSKSLLEKRENELKQSKRLIKEREDELDRLKETGKNAESYKQKYGAMDSCFEAYKSLSGKIHSDLSRVLNCESAEKFFCGGVQWENIEALWDAISYRLDKYSADEAETLKSVFDFLFDAYVSINKKYERLDAKVGDEFDEDVHTRGYNSPHVNGNITAVLLRGYKGIKNDKIRKSIVIM